MTPSGVVIARATELTIECVTWMNSIWKGPRSMRSPGFHWIQLGLVEHFVLFEAALDQGQRELGAVDRNVQLREQKRNAADVVLMAVREDQPADVFGILFEIA